MVEQRLSPEVARRLGDWAEDALANAAGSIEHGATVTAVIIEDDKASIPFTYKASGVLVEGAFQFDNLDSFAEIMGLCAAKANDNDLLMQMTSVAKSEESIRYLESLEEEK